MILSCSTIELATSLVTNCAVHGIQSNVHFPNIRSIYRPSFQRLQRNLDQVGPVRGRSKPAVRLQNDSKDEACAEERLSSKEPRAAVAQMGRVLRNQRCAKVDSLLGVVDCLGVDSLGGRVEDVVNDRPQNEFSPFVKSAEEKVGKLVVVGLVLAELDSGWKVMLPVGLLARPAQTGQLVSNSPQRDLLFKVMIVTD